MDFPAFMEEKWTEFDDEAWQKLLAEMVSTDPSGWGTSIDSGTQLGPPPSAKDLADRSTQHPADTNTGADQGHLVFPQDYRTVPSAEASPEAEPVPQAAFSGDSGITLEELKELVCYLQRE